MDLLYEINVNITKYITINVQLKTVGDIIMKDPNIVNGGIKPINDFYI